MRLIDADALMKWANDHYDFEVFTVGYFVGIIQDMPTVDAEPVIRCKDCKYHGEQYGDYCIKDERDEWYDEDYCSKAERKEE